MDHKVEVEMAKELTCPVNESRVLSANASPKDADRQGFIDGILFSACLVGLYILLHYLYLHWPSASNLCN